MEAEKVEYMDAEVIESKPLPVIHPIEVGLMLGSFFVGYLVGKSRAKGRKRKTVRSSKLKVQSRK